MKKRLFMRMVMLIAVCITSITVKAYTVEVVYDNTSGMDHVNYTATLDSGTVLGFYKGTVWYFSGVITSASSLVIPDSVLLNDTMYPVYGLGLNSYSLDLSQAPNLTSISSPTATMIGSYAFQECSSLTSIDFPAATDIGRYAFYNCSSLTSIDLPVVTTIEEDAFSECYSLTSINLPAATTIGNYAFNGCFSLTSIDLPAATTIGYRAFSGCYSLTSIDLPAATTIGRYAFDNCSSLTSINLPAATTIEEYAFSGCSSLTTITIPAEVGSNISSYGLLVVSQALQNVNIVGSTKASWSPSIFPSYADFIVWVEQSVYEEYRDWTIKQGIDVRYEGWQPNTIEVTVSTAGQMGSQILSVANQWTDVEALVVKGHIDSRDMRYFASMACLRTLDLSQTDITTISGCGGLQLLRDISLPETVMTVDKGAFEKCNRLKTLDLPAAATIGSSAFYNCSSLTSIDLPAVTDIGGDAFCHCSSLTSIDLPAATTIGYEAFLGCSSLTSIDLPAATTIEEGAFYNCSSLTSIDLPAATTIYQSAFSGCSSLTSIDLPAATTIGRYAFDNCSSLTSIDLPAATTIYQSAFSGCSSLTSINLPASLQTIGSGCFYSCSNLKDIYCQVVIPFQTDAFSSFPAGVTLHVPTFSVTPYKLHTSWGGAFENIVPISGETSDVVVNTDFTLISIDGLAAKPNLTVMESMANRAQGHLDVICPQAAVQLGSYVQGKSSYYSSYYDSYTDVATLITNSEMTADQVTVKLSLHTGQWYFVSFPFDVNVSDIQVPEGTLWVVRRYSGEDRAALTGNSWQDMTSGSVLKAGEGYIIQCATENPKEYDDYYYDDYETIEFAFPAVDNQEKNNIFTYSNVEKQLNLYESEYAYNRSWNLVGNPYPAYMNATKITHKGVITTWNGKGYTAYSLLDDQYVLSPFEAFFVQRADDVENISFNAEGRQHTSTEGNTNPSPARRSMQNNRQVFNFTLSDNQYIDRTRLVINPEAKAAYETSCDAAKMMSMNEKTPQLYILDNGVRYAIDERPVADGRFQLGVHVGTNGTYTIALQEMTDGQNSVILTDHQTGIQTDLANDSYTFKANGGTIENRFTISLSGEVTGIRNVNDSKDNEEEWFTVDGKQIKNGTMPGVYIVKKNGNSRKVVVTK